MSVSGLLKTMQLAEILEWIRLGQKTGVVVFERQAVVKKIYCEKGLVISAASNDPKDYLGQILLCFDWLSEEKLNEAFQLQAKSHKLLGKILVENYGLTETQILQALRMKIEETIYDLFLWDDGTFIYTDGLGRLPEHDRLDLALTVDHIIFEGARRLDEWKAFKKEYPSDDVIFKKKDETKELGDLAKDPLVNRIYQLVDGKRSIKRILLESRSPENRGIQNFGKLAWGGFLEATKASRPVKEKPLVATQVLLQEAISFYKEKRWEKAYHAIEQFMKDQPLDVEVQTLFPVVQTAYLEELRKLCPGTAIPELRLDLSSLSEKIFNSKEGFLASRITGQWDVQALVMLSPLGEFESLRILKRFLDEGVIRLKNL